MVSGVLKHLSMVLTANGLLMFTALDGAILFIVVCQEAKSRRTADLFFRPTVSEMKKINLEFEFRELQIYLE